MEEWEKKMWEDYERSPKWTRGKIYLPRINWPLFGTIAACLAISIGLIWLAVIFSWLWLVYLVVAGFFYLFIRDH